MRSYDTSKNPSSSGPEHPHFAAIAAACLAHAESLIPEWLPDGKREGQEWVALNPTRADAHPGSFKVNLHTGHWSDFATRDAGGDLISLYAYLNGLKNGRAVQVLTDRLGLLGSAYPSSAGAGRKPDWTPITPVPEDAPPPPAAHPKHGVPTALWTYRDKAGRVLCHVCRFDRAEGKEILPLTYCRRSGGKQGWRWQALSAPRPLYNLDRLAANPEAPVIVCEGEKAADAAAVLFPEHVGTTSPGGAQSARKADWSPLSGRRVLLWPDNDEPGRQYAAAVTQLLCTVKAADIGLLHPTTFSPELAPGWDAADALAQGWTAQRLAGLLADAANWIKPADSALEPGETDSPESPDSPAACPPDCFKEGAIYCKAGKLPVIVDQAERVLLDAEQIYQRGGVLVRPVRNPAVTVRGISRPESALTLMTVDADYLVDRLTRVVGWCRFSVEKGAWVNCDCPRSVATTLLARRGWWKFPSLVGVTSTPTLRPDGTVLDQPGYDPATGLLYEPALPFPVLPARPRRAAAVAALGTLRDVLRDFPFKEPHDRSVALAAILTAVVRRALKSAPLFTFSAPKMASGKSLLGDVIALIATGLPATVMSYTTDPDEMRKRITAVLMQGDAVLNIDNVETSLRGETLCSILTQEAFSDRLLGTNRTVTVPTACTWLATGNNLQIEGDLTTRVIPCDLDPHCERPEEREFDRNLYAWIPQHRVELVTAALVLLRAYLVAGKPKQPIKQFGRFEAWSDLVRSALVWLGEPDPNLARLDLEAADGVRVALRHLLVAWFRRYRTAPATSKEVCYDAQQTDEQNGGALLYPDLFDAIQEVASDRSGHLSTRRLGEYLKRYQGRIEAGARFVAAGVSHQAVMWRVELIDPATWPGESGDSGESVSPGSSADSHYQVGQL